MKSNKKGITLIALVVTIVVLLILAGISIAMLAGEDGIIANAQTAKIDSIHGEVKEAVIMKYGEYEIEKKTTKNTQTFIEYLKDKEYINSEGEVDTQKLTGHKLGLGNGRDGADVYIIKEDGNNYVLKYCDKDTSVEELSLWKVAIGSKSSDNLEDEECPECGLPEDECECNNICPDCGENPCICDGEIDGGIRICEGCGYYEVYDERCNGCDEYEYDCNCCELCGTPECSGECDVEIYEDCSTCNGQHSIVNGLCSNCEELEENCDCCPYCGCSREEYPEGCC